MRALVLSLLVLAACAEPPVPVERAIELSVATPSGEPVAGLRGWLDGALLGETKSDGLLRGTLRGNPYQRRLLSWACPAGHEPPTEQRELVLDPQATGTKTPPLKLEARCT